MAVIRVSLSTVNPVAGTEPKATAVAPVRWVPVRVTVAPPASGPWSGVSPVTTGAGA